MTEAKTFDLREFQNEVIRQYEHLATFFDRELRFARGANSSLIDTAGKKGFAKKEILRFFSYVAAKAFETLLKKPDMTFYAEESYRVISEPRIREIVRNGLAFKLGDQSLLNAERVLTVLKTVTQHLTDDAVRTEFNIKRDPILFAFIANRFVRSEVGNT